MSNSITVNSRKYDGSLSRSWQCEELERTSKTLKLRGVFEQNVAHRDLGCIEKGTISVEYFSENLWFNVFRFESQSGQLRNFYVNICMPPTITRDTVDYIDLDIDIVAWPDGRIIVIDRDEFEANASSFRYPNELLERVKSTVAYLLHTNDPDSWIARFSF